MNQGFFVKLRQNVEVTSVEIDGIFRHGLEPTLKAVSEFRQSMDKSAEGAIAPHKTY